MELENQTVKWMNYWWQLKTYTNQNIVTKDGAYGLWKGCKAVFVHGVWYEYFEGACK